MLEHCCGDLLPLVRLGTDVGRLCLARSLGWIGMQRRSLVEVRELCRPVKFFHTDLDKPFLYGPHFCTLNCCHKVGSTESSSLQKTHFQSGAELYTTPADVWHCAWWSLACVWLLAMENNFMKVTMNSSCADVASRGSLELGSECYNRGQTIFMPFRLLVGPFRELVWPTTSRLSCCCS